MLQSSSFERAPKICARHLERTAYVYVRQSTPQQVQKNPEGQENQKALAQRAVALGWSLRQVRVIDADLGLSGQSADGREGFRELTSEVSLGHAGIVLSYEASPAWRATTPTGTRSWICVRCGARSSPTPTASTTPPTTTIAFCSGCGA